MEMQKVVRESLTAFLECIVVVITGLLIAVIVFPEFAAYAMLFWPLVVITKSIEVRLQVKIFEKRYSKVRLAFFSSRWSFTHRS